MGKLTEDEVRNQAGSILGFTAFDSDGKMINIETHEYISGVGQLTTFNELGKRLHVKDYKGILDKPDGWYLPKDEYEPAIILETKASDKELDSKVVDEVLKNCKIVSDRYDKILGIAYNGEDVRVFKNNEELDNQKSLNNKQYYLNIFKSDTIDKQKIYNLTKDINNLLHFKFGIKNLYHRMIFTACALVAIRYNKKCLFQGMDYDTLHTAILSQVSKSLQKSKNQNFKITILTDVYAEIKMNRDTNSGDDIDQFIRDVYEISTSINSNDWRGEDVMGIFFNEFNRYKKKSDSGQIFTPEHITSFMYRLIDCNMDDYILDAACGSGGFLVKAMCNMMQEAGGVDTDKAKHIKRKQLYGIEFDREIYALACANMLIHKDGTTNLQQMDSRTMEACEWIKNQPITKVLMNPPYENKYGCIDIVINVLNSVRPGTACAFILPDKKLEKVSKNKISKMLKHNRIEKIIKLPENLFFGVGITTSIFVFSAGIPQNNREIFGCYIEDDGLVTVKNQGRQDIKDKWQNIEDKWIDIIQKQSGSDTIQWISPTEHLSYQMPEKEFEIFEEDFKKTIMDYIMYEKGIDAKEFNDKLMQKVLYTSEVTNDLDTVSILIKGRCGNDE